MALNDRADSLSPPQVRRARSLALFGLVGIAAVGFFTGVTGRRPPTGYAPPRAASAALVDIPRAPTNAELGRGGFGKNRARQAAMFAAMQQRRPAPTDPVVVSEADKAAALAARAARRAYDGAPPVIPHAVDGLAPNACLACHRDGMRVGEQTAPAMSHGEERVNCLQCHASQRGGPPVADPLALVVADNDFVGAPAPEGGQRAWAGAPPVIPHTTWMRERCESCHGVLSHGISSTHPARQSCQQCHARSAVLDQQPLGPGTVVP